MTPQPTLTLTGTGNLQIHIPLHIRRRRGRKMIFAPQALDGEVPDSPSDVQAAGRTFASNCHGVAQKRQSDGNPSDAHTGALPLHVPGFFECASAVPAVCGKRLYRRRRGDRSPRASQASAGSVLGRLELAAYLPPVPRTEDGHGDPRPAS